MEGTGSRPHEPTLRFLWVQNQLITFSARKSEWRLTVLKKIRNWLVDRNYKNCSRKGVPFAPDFFDDREAIIYFRGSGLNAVASAIIKLHPFEQKILSKWLSSELRQAISDAPYQESISTASDDDHGDDGYDVDENGRYPSVYIDFDDYEANYPWS